MTIGSHHQGPGCAHLQDAWAAISLIPQGILLLKVSLTMHHPPILHLIAQRYIRKTNYSSLLFKTDVSNLELA